MKRGASEYITKPFEWEELKKRSVMAAKNNLNQRGPRVGSI